MHELVQDDAARGGDLPDALAGRAADEQHAVVSVATIPRARAPPAARAACGLRTRTDPPTRAVSSPSVDSTTSRPRLMISTRSTVCATSASTWLETSTVRPPAANERRKSRSQRTPSGSSPFAGSSSIEQLRVAEQRRGEAEPLPHPERVALHAPVRRAVELDEPQHLVDARVGMPGRARERPQVVAAGAAGVEVGRLEHRADAQRRPLELARTARSNTSARPLVGGARPSSIRSVVVLPAPFGPRKPVTVPASSSNERPSTAVSLPKRFVSDSAATTAGTAGTLVGEGRTVPAVPLGALH